MAEIIVITSGKGGVGKTTTTANIGAALAKRDKKVMLIDGDVGLRNLDIALNKNEIVYDFTDIINNRCSVDDAVEVFENQPNLYFLPASQMSEESVTEQMMIDLCGRIKDDFDYILIDCPAGIGAGFKSSIAAADRAIIVMTPDLPSARDADRVAGLLEENGINKISLIINRIRVKMIKKGDMLGVDKVIDMMGVETIGLIPEDKKILSSYMHGKLVIDDRLSVAGGAYENIAARICGIKVPLINLAGRRRRKFKTLN